MSVNKRAVICWETGECFESIAAATRAVGLKSQNSIQNALKTGGAGGSYHWFYVDQPKPAASELGGHRRVICWETGEEYPNLAAAAAAKGLRCPSNIGHAALNGNTAGGYHWYYDGQPRPGSAQLKSGRRGRTPKPIACVETGEVFPNAAAATKAAGLLSKANIYNAIQTGARAGGCHWQFADDSKPSACRFRTNRR